METPPTVLTLVDPSIAITGAFVAARSMARLLANDARVLLVLPAHHRIAPEELTNFWRVETIPMVALSKNIPALLRYIPALFTGSWRLRKIMKRNASLHLILNDFYLMHGALLRLFGFRAAITSWVRCDPKRFAGPLASPMLWLLNLTSTRIVAVSRHVQRLLPAALPSTLIYDCYTGQQRDTNHWQMADAKPLVAIGNYIPGKGQDMLLAAFIRAAAADSTITLAFYGGDMGREKNRHYRATLEATAQQSAYANRITFHDAVRDSYPILATAYAALNGSTSESFSMTVLEAQGAGVPVIATASGGPQEIIVDGITGFLVAVGDADAMAEKIRALAHDPTSATRMGKAAATHTTQHFSPRQFHDALINVLSLPKQT